ncbi:hypothetical protein DIU31_019830 [Mucilaginibacter rubeus]|uniref:Uncharacterized protein n=1 Tax=Mucilaginibacter rubeus TaxID=2027860 RepID=A0AAE6JIL5_9SPHI|nr:MULTISPECIES: hypothetical protein [Mucilaginibacter]QEM05655.1 hypothetical protein DIU31_019830 [Mucilaginibacter rubeus]QEM18242.1 hypothetical protein DIU38_020035 [Mucilaginibacter gossypii]QTE45226.1 hypothetical protein J3L19_07675 [Mucilaginibacter rubeus]QTE51822.1 hypothetical protein J3L21_07650 [Mucilaginibacter rubeus]QTE56909.1 hypothetical protein J3L23_32885 [Mucilaginibacter rubeus]
MSKAQTLKVLSVITFLEIVGMVVWPIILGWGQLMSSAGLLLSVIFVFPLIYYVVFIIFLSRYAQRDVQDQNIGLVIFLNVLPVIALLYVLDVF